MPVIPKSFEDCLPAVGTIQRIILEKLRKQIKTVAPKSVEGVNYGLAAFLLNGKPLVAIGASTNHCAFYPMTGHTVAESKDDLKDYETSKGAIRFTTDKPLPATLVKKLVKARIAENEAKFGKGKTEKVAVKKSLTQLQVEKSDSSINDFIKELIHPLKSVIEAVRKLILGVRTDIQEGIKWNSPSFRTTEWFATMNLRNDRIWLILHTGAKVNSNAKTGMNIDDPSRILDWLAKDRGVVKMESMKDFQAKKKDLGKLIHAWVAHQI